MKSSIPLKWQLLFFAIVHILIFSLLFNASFWGQRYSAAGLFYDYANRVMQGQIVYRDFVMEYPPLALLFFILPRLITANYSYYAFAFIVEIVLFDLLGLFLVAKLAQRLNRSLMTSLTIYTLALVTIGPLMADRYDLIPAVLTLLAIYAFCYGKQKIAWVMLALGTMTKVYPAIIAPIFLLYNLRYKQYRRILSGTITYAVASVIIVAPFLLLAPKGFLYSFGYHVERGLQLETTYSSILLLGHSLGLVSVKLEFAFGAWNVVSPAADNLARLSELLLLLALALVYWRFYHAQREGAVPQSDLTVDQLGTGNLINGSFLAILAFLVFGKVLSPQFIIWLYPLVPLVAGRARNWTWVAFIFIAFLTYYIYPLHYFELMALEQSAIMILVIRNVLLVGLFILLLVAQQSSGLTMDNAASHAEVPE